MKLVKKHSKNGKSDLYKEVENYAIKSYGKLYTTSRELNSVLRKTGCDLIHFPSFTSYQIALYNVRFPIVVTLHDIIPVLYPDYSPFIKSIAWRMLAHHAKPRVKRWITVSEFSKQDICKQLHVSSDIVDVTYTATDPIYKPFSQEEKQQSLEIVRNKFNINGPFILSVTAFEPRKNIPRLVQAFEILKTLGYPHKLVIAGGDVWGGAEGHKAIDTSRYKDDIVQLSYTDKYDLVHLYNTADVFVFPSLYEGYGLPPVEAMACGCPVVTSNVTSIPEVVGDAALLCNPYDPEDIAEKMDIALSMDRQILIQKGLARARQFTWDKVVQQTWDLYCSVAGG